MRESSDAEIISLVKTLRLELAYISGGTTVCQYNPVTLAPPGTTLLKETDNYAVSTCSVDSNELGKLSHWRRIRFVVTPVHFDASRKSQGLMTVDRA